MKKVMKFKSKSVPSPTKGVVNSDKKGTQPDQSMSLKEILTRFVRGERLPVGMEGEYYETEYDLEKVKDLDPVEKAEIIRDMRAKQKAYENQEKRKAELARLKLVEEERAKIRAEEAAKLANNTP